MKYKKSNRNAEDKTPEYLLHIANEIAESNRLTRLHLEMKFRTNAIRALYRTYKGPKGEEFHVPPDDKQKEEYKEEIEAIRKELQDHAVEKIDDQSKGDEK